MIIAHHERRDVYSTVIDLDGRMNKKVLSINNVTLFVRN